MATRKPLVRIDGRTRELPAGDSIPIEGAIGGGDPNDPLFVEVVNFTDQAQDTVAYGVSGTVSIPANGRAAVVSAIAPTTGSATISVGAQPPITIPVARNFSDSFRFTEEGPFDIVFTGTEAYYVRYFTSDFVPAEMVQV